MRMRDLLLQASLVAASCFLLFFKGQNADMSTRQLNLDEGDGFSKLGLSGPSPPNKGFNTTGRLVLSTMPREMTGQPPDRIKYAKYHLRCIAEVAKVSDVHIVIYTSDDELARYVEEGPNEGGELAARMEIAKVPLEEDMEYTILLKRLRILHPGASGYGWMNGDICPTPAFIEAANKFIEADCSEGGEGIEVESKWRFISGNRYNVERSMAEIDLESESALEIASSGPREALNSGGADIFIWNRAMYIGHLLPMIPEFSLPLFAVDNFFIEDGHCNAMVLMAEHGWSSDALPLHLAHPRTRNGLGTATLKSESGWGSHSRHLNNWEQRGKVDKSKWKRQRCQSRPIEAANDCHYNFETDSFNCDRKGIPRCTVSKK